MSKKELIATGRRKRAIAQVKLVSGNGKITVNGVDINEYMPSEILIKDLKQPLVLTDNEKTFDVIVKVTGGGYSGQAGAIRLGITKALLNYDSENDQNSDDSYRKILKSNGLVTRDPRVKERKKPGLKKARRAPQFSKR